MPHHVVVDVRLAVDHPPVPDDPAADAPEYAGIHRMHEGHRQRQRYAGIALDDIAVVQNQRGIARERRDPSCLKNIDHALLHRKLNVKEFPKDFPDPLRDVDQRFHQLFGEQIFPAVVIIHPVCRTVVIRGGFRLFRNDVFADAPCHRNDRFVQQTLRVGGEDHACKLRVDHPLHDHIHSQSVGGNAVLFRVFPDAGGMKRREALAHLFLYLVSADVEERPELSREAGAVAVLDRRGASHREQTVACLPQHGEPRKVRASPAL